MVSESWLEGSSAFEPRCIFISHFIKTKEGCLWFVYLGVCAYVFPRAGIRPHVRNGARVQICIFSQHPVNLSFLGNWSFNEYGLFCLSQKKKKKPPSMVCLSIGMCTYVSQYAGMRLHVRNDARVHDIYC